MSNKAKILKGLLVGTVIVAGSSSSVIAKDWVYTNPAGIGAWSSTANLTITEAGNGPTNATVVIVSGIADAAPSTVYTAISGSTVSSINFGGGAIAIAGAVPGPADTISLNLTNNFTFDVAGAVVNTLIMNAGNLTVTLDHDITVTTPIAASGHGGTIALAGNSTITGAVDASAQTLHLNPNSHTLTLTGGITGATTVDVTSAGTIAGAVTATNITTGAGNVSFTGNVTATAAADLTITTAAGNLGITGNVIGAVGGAHNIIFAAGGAGGVIVSGTVGTATDIIIDGTNHTTEIQGVATATTDITVSNTDHLTKFGAKIGGGTLKIGQNAAASGPGAGVQLNNGTAGAVTFTQNGLLALGGNIGGVVDATANGGTIVLTGNSTIGGAVNGKNMMLALGGNTLTLGNGGALTGDVILQTTVTGAPGTQGNVNVTGGTLHLDGANSVTIEITSGAGYTPGRSYEIIGAQGGGSINFGVITPVVHDASPLVSWVQVPKGTIIGNAPGGTAPATFSAPITHNTPLIFTPVFNESNAVQLADAIAKTSHYTVTADEVMKIFDLYTNTGGANKLTIELTSAIKDINIMTAAMENIVHGGMNANVPAAMTQIVSDVSKFIAQVISVRSANMQITTAEGLSAGDEQTSANHGAWVMGIGGMGRQKATTNDSGYRNKLYGGIIGADTKLNENIFAGIAVGRTDTKVFHKGAKIGDRTKIPTWMVSLYGMYDFGNNWFTQSTVSYSDSHVNNRESRVVGGNAGNIVWGIASSKYHSKSAGIDLVGGYKYSFHDNYSLTPSAGIAYSSGRDNGYTETGAGNANYTFNKKTYNSTSGLFGMRLGYSHTTMNDLTILPEVHANLRTRFKGKDPKIVSSLSGQATPLTSTYKASKNSYTIGTSVTAQGKMLDLTVGYDTQLSKKYLGHQGSLKIKVNL